MREGTEGKPETRNQKPEDRSTATFLVTSVSILFSLNVSAGVVNRPDLEKHLRQTFQICPESKFKISTVDLPGGPKGFTTYRIEQRSSDARCDRAGFALVSATTKQVIVGDIYPIEQKSPTLEKNIATLTEAMMKTPVDVKIDPAKLPDGIRRVRIIRKTDHGPFTYGGFVDASQRFLLIGRRGEMGQDPRPRFLTDIGIEAGARRGTLTAKIDIVELSDFQCPTCKLAHEALEPLIKNNLNRVSYTRLDLPLFEHHDWTLQASLAGRAIQRVAPAKYWEYVDYMFANQGAIKKSSVETLIKGFCDDHDIDWKKIAPIYNSPKEKEALLAQSGRAFDNGIFATPTYIVNGQVIFYGEEGKYLKSYLEKILKPAGPGKAR